MPNQLREGFTRLPDRISMLPIDERGYPIPFFVAYDKEGKPDFRVMDEDKFLRAMRDKLCWVCGHKLGRYLAFPGGPMCAINRTSAEPPSHLECAEWSVKNCPFLNQQQSKRREDETTAKGVFAGGTGLLHQPGVIMIWVTKSFQALNDGKGGVILRMGEPEHVVWWTHSRPATRAEVETAINIGYPALLGIATQEDLHDAIHVVPSKVFPKPKAVEALAMMREAVNKYLPKE